MEIMCLRIMGCGYSLRERFLGHNGVSYLFETINLRFFREILVVGRSRVRIPVGTIDILW